MGSGEEKSGFMSSRWMTIVLIAVLVILAVALIWILKDPRGFDRFRKKKSPESLIKPTVNLQLHNPNERLHLESVDHRLGVVAELSWQESVSPFQV